MISKLLGVARNVTLTLQFMQKYQKLHNQHLLLVSLPPCLKNTQSMCLICLMHHS